MSLRLKETEAVFPTFSQRTLYLPISFCHNSICQSSDAYKKPRFRFLLSSVWGAAGPNAVLYSRFIVLGVKMEPTSAMISILSHIVYDLYRNMNFLSVAYQSIISISDTSRLASIESQAMYEQSLFQVLSQIYFEIRFLYNTNCSNRQWRWTKMNPHCQFQRATLENLVVQLF